MKHLCDMLTNMYTRAAPLNQVVGAKAKEIFTRLIWRQKNIALMDYNQRNTPHLVDVLQVLEPRIETTDDEVNILIDYPATIRYLDLKKTKYGKKKRYYTPIYNRPLFGHLYGRGYSFATIINLALQQEYHNYFINLQRVTKLEVYE